jgi:hypothetical protein
MCIRDLLFADDAALTTHTAEDLQNIMDRLQGLSISLNKIKVLAQDANDRPSISISNFELYDVNEFIYLGSTISDRLPA